MIAGTIRERNGGRKDARAGAGVARRNSNHERNALGFSSPGALTGFLVFFFLPCFFSICCWFWYRSCCLLPQSIYNITLEAPPSGRGAEDHYVFWVDPLNSGESFPDLGQKCRIRLVSADGEDWSEWHAAKKSGRSNLPWIPLPLHSCDANRHYARDS